MKKRGPLKVEQTLPGGDKTAGLQWTVMAVSALAAIALFSMHRIASFDYWTHLAFGRLYLETGALSIPEPFIAGMENMVADATEWPFQIFLHLIEKTFSHAGVSITAALFAALAAYPLVRMTKGRGSSGILAILFIGSVFFAIRGRYAARPEIIVYALTVLTALLAHGWAGRPRLMPLLALVPLFLIWAPLHVSWTVGASMILLIIITEPNTLFWKNLVKTPGGLTAAALLGILALTAAWSAVEFAVHVLAAMSGGGRMAFINEMLPLWRFPEIALPFGLLAALALAMSWGGPQGRVRRLAQWAASFVMAVLVARNYGMSLLFMTPPALEGFFSYRLAPLARRARMCLAAGLSAMAVFTVISLRDTDPAWGAGVDAELFPADAAAFHKNAGIPAPVFNSFDIGGYLDYAWRGTPRTYIDGRATAVPGRIEIFQEITNSADPFSRLDSEGINSVVTRGVFQNSGRIFPLAAALLQNPEWKLVRATDALVFARAGRMPEKTAIPGTEGWRFIARECALLTGRGRSGPHFDYTLGISLLMSGETEKGMDLLRIAAATHPEFRDYYAKYLFRAGIGF